jgi:hypothetical protein
VARASYLKSVEGSLEKPAECDEGQKFESMMAI